MSDNSLNQTTIVQPVAAIDSTPALETTVPVPPRWLKLGVHYFRIGFALFLFLSTALGLVSCRWKPESSWQPATAIAPEPLWQNVVQQNTSLAEAELSATIAQMRVWEIPGKEGKLVLVDFNQPDLCGQLGCLYVGIWVRAEQPPRQVFSTYLDPNLPEGKSLFGLVEPEVTKNQRQQALPCLQVMQAGATQTSNQFRQVNFCFDGQQYRAVDGAIHG